MASAFKPNVRTYIARGTVPPYSFVKLDSTAPSTTKNPGVVSCTSGASHGISQNDASVTSGQEVEVALPGGGALLKVGGSVSLGNTLMPTTAGVGIVTTTAGDHVGARAYEAGATNDIIGVHVVQFEKYNGDAN